MRRCAVLALACTAFGCDPAPPPPKAAPPAVEAQTEAAPPGDFDKFARGEIERLSALGFVTTGKIKHEEQMTGSPATIPVHVLIVDVVRKGKAQGPHEVLAQAQRDKDNHTVAAFRRQHDDPQATFKPPHKYTVAEIAARTVFVIHLDLKYRPQKGTWRLFRGNARVTSAKGLEDKDIALEKYVVGQSYVAWRLEDLERLY